MEIKTVIVCPMGKQCEEIKDNDIHRCAWLTKLAGQLPDGTQADEQGCAISWLPILLIENARTMRGTSAAVESFRNEMVDFNQATLPMIGVKR